MTDAQVISLSLMFMVGWMGVFPLIENPSRRVRIACWVWVCFWCAPSLIALWLKGVMG